MPVGRFIAMVGMLVWRRSDGRYLLLRRSPERGFAPGQWETGSGRLEQGEGYVQALRREAREELGLDVRIECILGTTHFYRGAPTPENDMVGVSFGCSVEDASGLSVSARTLGAPVGDRRGGLGARSSGPLARQAHRAGRRVPRAHAGVAAQAALGRRLRVLGDGLRR